MIITYLIHLAILIGIFIILAVSLNLVVGYTGLMNLGHIAFYGIGAYTSTLLVIRGYSFFIALVVGGLVAALCGLLLTYITQKLNGDYVALATLGFGFVVYSVFLNWTSLTRGPLGIAGIPRPNIFGWHVNSSVAYLILTTLVAIFVVLFLYRLTRSRYGKLIQGVRDEAVGLSVLGKDVARLKRQSMMISAFLAGFAGSLYAHYISFIDPYSFFLADLIVIFTIVIVGGLASLKGSVVATFIIMLVPEALRFTPFPSNIIGPVRQILYGIILLVILLVRPRGLFGKVDLE